MTKLSREGIASEFTILENALRKDDPKAGLSAIINLLTNFLCDVNRIADAVESLDKKTMGVK